VKLDPEAIALLEANPQATIDFLARLATQGAPDTIPPAAIVALERARAERLAQGLSGYLMLRIDDAPGRPPYWRVIAGETVVATSSKKFLDRSHNMS
jgi:hypothetical protein